VEIAEVEEGHVLAVRLGGYGLNDILLVGQPDDEGKVFRIQEELHQLLESEHICSKVPN